MPMPLRRSPSHRLARLAILAAIGLTAFFGAAAANASEDADPFIGPPPISPRWAFEPWVWEDNGNTRETLTGLIDGYRERGIPVGAVIIDSPWETAYNNFEWDRERYPEPGAMIAELRADDIRVVLWITGAMNRTGPDAKVPQSLLFNEVIEQGLAVDGGREFEWWKGRGVHIDFTRAEARAWFAERLQAVMSTGVDGWKVDQAEHYLADEVDTSIGRIPKSEFKKHYYGAVHDAALAHGPESLILARPYSHQGGFAASVNKCTVGWGGDYSGTFAGLRDQMADLYRSAEAGYGALCVEVGGYWQEPPTRESLIRYAQFGALMPVMSNGGSNGGLSQHLPWHHDNETVDIYRTFAVLHSELAPYLFSASVEAHLGGSPIVRDADPQSARHRLGGQLFVSPVVAAENRKRIELPAGDQWIDYWDHSRVLAGGSVVEETVPLERLPLFIRAGAILPMAVNSPVTGHGDASSAGLDTVLVFPSGDSDYTYHRPDGDGIAYSDVTLTCAEDDGTISVSSDATVAYRFRIRSFAEPAAVSGADSWRYDADSGVIVADKRGATFEIRVDGLQGYSGRGPD